MRVMLRQHYAALSRPAFHGSGKASRLLGRLVALSAGHIIDCEQVRPLLRDGRECTEFRGFHNPSGLGQVDRLSYRRPAMRLPGRALNERHRRPRVRGAGQQRERQVRGSPTASVGETRDFPVCGMWY